MAENGTDIFQELHLRTQLTPVSIRNCILDQIRKPWYHDTMQEKKIKESTSGYGDVIAVRCDSVDDIFECGLVLLQENYGYKLVNIILLNKSELGVDKYNKIVQDFVLNVVEPAAQVGGFEIDFLSV